MRHFLLFFLFIAVLYTRDVFAFNLTLNRDPFMNLVTLSHMNENKGVVHRSQIQNYIKMIKDTVSVEGVFISITKPQDSVAILVGPSRIPIIVKENQKIKNNVVVYRIFGNGVELHILTTKRFIPIKLYVNEEH